MFLLVLFMISSAWSEIIRSEVDWCEKGLCPRDRPICGEEMNLLECVTYESGIVIDVYSATHLTNKNTSNNPKHNNTTNFHDSEIVNKSKD